MGPPNGPARIPN